MPVLEIIGFDWLVCRFSFSRTLGPGKGTRHIGNYYYMGTTPPGAVPTGAYLGFEGYLAVDPPREFGHDWQPIARSVPAPLVLGTTSVHSLNVKELYYWGRCIQDVEDFLRAAPDNIGPFPGDLIVWDMTGMCQHKRYPECYFKKLTHSYDGMKTFVEYSLLFETNQEPVLLDACFTPGGTPPAPGCGGQTMATVLSRMDKEMHTLGIIPALDLQDTGLTLGELPVAESHVFVTVNGQVMPVGDGVVTEAFYFEKTPGVAKTFAELLAGDSLFYNGAIVGHTLTPADTISIHYLVEAPVPP